jgi:hypothetical protein
MKYIIIILLVCFGFMAKAQVPTGFPSQRWAGYIEPTYVVPDSGTIITKRDTLFTPRFVGTTVTWQRPGIDTTFWFWNGRNWGRVSAAALDTTSLSNRINLKLNISDTSSMLSPYLRKIDTLNKWVQNVYARNDSLFKLKNGTESFVHTFPTSGSGTVTSVGLSMPAAFSVSGSPVTTSGTLNVSGAGTSLQYIRGDGTLATMDTTAIPNFFIKARSLLSGTSPINYNSNTGTIGILNANTTGQKGAATFNNSNFSDNGSGTISLADVTSAGTCLNCQITFNSKGQATSYSDGIITLLANAPGAGDTLVVSGDTIKRLNAGYGILHTVTNYSITEKIDTTIISPILSANNGLSKIGNTIQLGGALTKNDTLDAGSSYSLQLLASGTNSPLKITQSGSANGAFINTFPGTGIGLNVQSNNANAIQSFAFGTGYGASLSSVSNLGAYIGTTSGLSGAAIEVNPSSTNTSQTILQLKRYTSGTAANNIAGRVEFITEPSSGTVDVTSGYLESGWEDATFATRKSWMALYTTLNGSTSKVLNMGSNGQMTLPLYSSLTAQTDSTTYKPVAIDGSGNVVKMANWVGGGGSGTVTSVSATSPIVVTNPTTTPNISIPAATSSVNGYMSSANIQKYDTAVRGRIYTMSQLGILSDANINIGSTSFGTDQKTAIQAVLDKAINGPITIIWDVKCSTSGTLYIRSNTRIVFNPGCGIIARDSINADIFMNKNPSGTTHLDSNIVLTGSNYIINGNGGHQLHNTVANGWVVAVRFTGCDNVIVENANIVASRTFHIWFMNCDKITINNIYIDYAPGYNTNQFGTFDGIHINGPSSYITVNNEKVRANDDVFALNADDVWQNTDTSGICTVCGGFSSYDPFATFGDITDVNADGITFLPGCQFGFRLLSAASAIKRVTIRNVKGTTSLQEFIIDNWHDGEPAHPGPGNIEDLVLENIFGEVTTNVGSHNYKNCYINFGCYVNNATIKGLSRSLFTQATYPTINIDSYGVINDLSINNFVHHDGAPDDGVPMISVTGLVNSMTITQAAQYNLPRDSANVSLVKMQPGGLIKKLQINGLNFDSVASVLDITAGKIYYINGTNIITQNTPFAFVYTQDTIKRLTLSNFTSSSGIKDQLGAGGVLLDSAGDAFSQSSGVPTLQQVLTAGNTSTLAASVSGVTITRGTGSNRDIAFTNTSTTNNFATLALRATGTNSASDFAIMPNNAGYSSTIKAQIDIFNTDYSADQTNFEDLYISAGGTNGYSFNSVANGTGTVRPITFTTGSNTSQLVLKTTGAIQFGNYTAAENEIIYTNTTGDLNHYTGGTNGQVLTHVTGGFAWQSLPSSITSINSQTGPSITLAGSNGLTATTTSNTVTYTLGGSITGFTQITGGGNSLLFGTSGSHLSGFTTYGDAINLIGNVRYGTEDYATDADHTVSSAVTFEELHDVPLTANRTITLPSAVQQGQILTIVTRYSTGTNHFVLSGAIVDNSTGATFTQLDWGKRYDFYVDSAVGWILISKY